MHSLYKMCRFATEVAGVPEIGAIGRGENMEITTYLEKSMESELSANVIDLCLWEHLHLNLMLLKQDHGS